ncbi:MAG: monomethylamine:corrinoid methyltransferase [Chloroflexi bacterium]|nr:monomethylamine:corrinoid methyltransferase [Chloroflexota bacterium]
MRNTTRLLDVLDRMESGPIVEESQWDMFMVPDEVARVQVEFDIDLNALGDKLVSADDALADRVFAAGLTLAERLGVYCISTSRQIKFSRAEILAALAVAPTEVTFGEGGDRHTERKRQVEDPAHLTIKGGGVGTPIPEHLYLAVHQSYAQESLVDGMINCTLERVYGREIRSRSPWEVLGGWHEVELTKAACRRAGRPGLGLGCVENAVSELSELSATSYGGFSPNDWHHIAMISEFKTDYGALTKLAHLVRTGSVIHAFYNTIYGGSVGGKEGMAIAIVAGSILLQMIYMTNTHSVSPAHPFYDNDTTPEIIQAISVGHQALARNSRLLTDLVITPVSGPGTSTLLYETAAMAIMAAASGSCGLIGPRSAAGIHPAHVSGLEARWMAEVAHAAAGISRGEADALVRQLVALYQPTLNKRPIGKPFPEVYDPVMLRPSPEWQGTYEVVKQELAQMGLAIP